MKFVAKLVIVVLVVGITGIYPLVAPPCHRIDNQHFQRIKKGMTRTQVETIFGVPSGEYGAEVNAELMRRQIAEELMDEATEVFVARLLRMSAPNAGLPSDLQKVSHDVRERIEITKVDLTVPLDQLSLWTSRRGAVAVLFDSNGCVRAQSFRDQVRVLTMWEYLKRIFKRK
jgi:hypothetical protein